MRRRSVRLRVVLASTLAMTVVLVGLGAFLHLEVRRTLDGGVARTLDGRVADVAGSLAAGRAAADVVPSGEADDDAVLLQVLDRGGRVRAASPGLSPGPLLTAAELADARDDDVEVARRAVALRDDDGGTDGLEVRLAARPVDDDRPDLGVVVAAAGLEERDAAVRSLDTALLVGVPVAVALSALLGWALAAGALRPVEAMRRRAERIAGPSEERLPVPPSRDEIARLGRTLNAMLDRQSEGFRRERAFVADASHELRTPLTILRTELDLAGRGDRDVGELRAALASASEETRRLERLAEDLLVLARAEGSPREDDVPIPVRSLLEDVRDRCSAVFAAEGRELVVRWDDDAPTSVRGRRGALDRALTGLVENALRHGAGTVELRADRSGGTVRLHVLDRGPGLAEALRGRAFDRFVTGTHEHHERRGTGLGLAIVAAVAVSHGGPAALDERPDGGLDAWIAVADRAADAD